MIIYAVLMCVAVTGQCQMLPLSPAEPGLYRTLAECRAHLLPSPSRAIAFRCLSRKVETWR